MHFTLFIVTSHHGEHLTYERPEDLIHRLSACVKDYLHWKDMGIAHDGETTKGDEEFNKATTQCPISNKGVEYVHIHVQLTTDNY